MLDEACGRYRNPLGKTGIGGRGQLGRWGPNHAADCIVTRACGGRLEVLLATKHTGDSCSLCFPGGMVEPGADVPETLRDELVQEAVQDTPDVDRVFSEGRQP